MDPTSVRHRRPRSRPLAAGSLLGLLLLPVTAGAQHDHDAAMANEMSPKLQMHGFTDVTLWGNRDKPTVGDASTQAAFALGQFDVYFISHLGQYVSFVAETVFELGANGEEGIDVERAYVKYSRSDYARIAVGRVHTALGYWNTNFHHGAFLAPTVERPEGLKFEDDGGILPVHSVGLEISGETERGDWDLGYVANVANGRGANREGVQGGQDLNRDKAVALKLSATRSRNVHIGGSIYRDRIPADPIVSGREGEIDETIPGGYFVVTWPRVELLSEVFRVHHEDRATHAKFDNNTWYATLVGKFGIWKPYVGVDRVDFASGDPYFAGGDRDLTRGLAGVRCEIGSFSAVKVEFRHDKRPGEKSDAVAIQSSFTF